MVKRDFQLGPVLKERRIKLGFSQKEVASRAGILLQQYQKLESDERNIMKSSFFISCMVLEALEFDATAFFNEYRNSTVEEQ